MNVYEWLLLVNVYYLVTLENIGEEVERITKKDLKKVVALWLAYFFYDQNNSLYHQTGSASLIDISVTVNY